MTRKIALLATALLLLFGSQAFAYKAQLLPFKDETYDYSRDPIYTLSALGIVNGYEDRTFRPDVDLTREAFLRLLVQAVQPNAVAAGAKLPADVESNRWSASSIRIAAGEHWIDTLIDAKGNLRPAQTITRQEVAMLVGRALLGAESKETQSAWLNAGWKQERDARAFKDQAKIAPAMQPYVYYASKLGMMEGDKVGFKPAEPLIRKQAAAVIYRLIDGRIADRKVDFTGFYAISSVSALNQMDKLSNVIFGWSRLSYDAAGAASLDVTSADTKYRVPSGYEQVVAAADAAGASKELMVFYDGANLSEFLKDAPAQAAFLDSLLAKLGDPSFGFTGVSIDFEGLKDAASAADYTRFLQALRDRLGELTLSVAVPPIEYYKGYDLKAIGQFADTVILMAYDFTHNQSKLPSAPLPLVNETVATALAAIPKEKLVLGISKQANQWITKDGVTGPALSPEIAAVESRLAMPGVTKTWTMPYFLTKATYASELGSNELYYEDAQSIAKKIWLAKFYGLKGVSLWYMGNYTAADWAVVGEQSSK